MISLCTGIQVSHRMPLNLPIIVHASLSVAAIALFSKITPIAVHTVRLALLVPPHHPRSAYGEPVVV